MQHHIRLNRLKMPCRSPSNATEWPNSLDSLVCFYANRHVRVASSRITLFGFFSSNQNFLTTIKTLLSFNTIVRSDIIIRCQMPWHRASIFDKHVLIYKHFGRLWGRHQKNLSRFASVNKSPLQLCATFKCYVTLSLFLVWNSY